MNASTHTDEQISKDRFFERVGVLAEEMIAAHGKDFAMGVLILTARFIAEGKNVGLSAPKPDKP
jgi:hypothetical protein